MARSRLVGVAYVGGPLALLGPAFVAAIALVNRRLTTVVAAVVAAVICCLNVTLIVLALIVLTLVD